jgi:hypothetical protein
MVQFSDVCFPPKWTIKIPNYNGDSNTGNIENWTFSVIFFKCSDHSISVLVFRPQYKDCPFLVAILF